MKIAPVFKGFASYIPGIQKIIAKRGTGGTDSAEYCYGVWLKHLTMMWENGIQRIPDTVAELGPGDSIGIGLAALLSGVKNYYALDVVEFVNTERNLLIFEELVDFFKSRKSRPNRGWPVYDDYLDSNLFPSHILTWRVLDDALHEERIESIRNLLLNIKAHNVNNEKVTIKYFAPWNELHVIKKESIDAVLSHSVLEHVNDLENTYKALSLWLKPKGMMSHQIDFSSHNYAKKWNGHWAYSDLLWKMMVGKRPYMLNRQPCSTHIKLIEKNNFKIRCFLKNNRTDGIERSELLSGWRNISEEDFRCATAFIQAVKL